MLARSCPLLAACLVVLTHSYEVDNVKAALTSYEASYPGGLTMHVYAPKSDSTFPVIWFATGFGADVPLSIYGMLIENIVSRGYIVAGVYHEVPHVPQYIPDGKTLHDLMEWSKENLAVWMSSQKLTAVPDVLDRTAIMGQSSGNHIAGQALTNGCSVAKAFIMIDPVDGFDPFRVYKGEDLIKPGQKVKFNIPALLLDNGLDPTAVNPLFPPCAPASVSNDHFYNAWLGPIWNINATAYGHMDCADSAGQKDQSTWPHGIVCPSNTHGDKSLYRNMLAESITSFLSALFNDKPEAFSVLEDPAHWKVDTVLKRDLKGKSHAEIKAGCVNIASLPDVMV